MTRLKDEIPPAWHEVRAKYDLPRLKQRVLFESRSGFRFYGAVVTRDEIEMTLHGKRVSWLYISRWQDASRTE